MSDTEHATDHDGPPRAVLIAALAVAVAAAVAVVVVAALHQSQRAPVAIATVPAPHATEAACQTLLAALPDRLGDYQRARAVEPVPAGAAAWQAQAGTEPVILRCGLDRPAEFVLGAPLQVVDAVSWLRVADAGTDGRITWFAVDRPVYIALTLPPGSGPTPIQELSEVIAKSLPAQPIAPGAPR
ncbi:MAG TPA: DUF3515 domain-containing protein [Mycobacterium sp.]|nr:DUF3515 domain-containing protein [Mycobacterium sp.]